MTFGLKYVVERIISPNQGAFVWRRWIAENLIITQELSHNVSRHKVKKGLMLIKMDMQKTYNQLEWRFIKKALQT